MSEWKCRRCGDCCRFIIIPVKELIDLDTEAYLEAHGIIYDEGKLIIPAVCQYLGEDNLCKIHGDKFANCRLAGEKECKACKEAYKCLLNQK